MEVRAVARMVRISPYKVRPVINMVRGRRVDDALNILMFHPSRAARIVSKVIRSAAANAENNFEMAGDRLRIVKIYADEGPRLKRWRPKARGRAVPIIKRTCHITVVVEEESGP